MPGLYAHSSRVSGELITAAKYNADNQNHIDNQTPQMTDDYSTSAAQMQAESDPGELASESLPTSLAGELERIRYAIREAKGTTHWYQTPATTLAAVPTTVTDVDLLIWGII
jgi:hypothetical protein